MKAWKIAKIVAFHNQLGLCTICHAPMYWTEKGDMQIVGHHIKGRCRGGGNNVENCEVRHAHCEHTAHQLCKGGNRYGNDLQK